LKNVVLGYKQEVSDFLLPSNESALKNGDRNERKTLPVFKVS
jgi:hypothetical protein